MTDVTIKISIKPSTKRFLEVFGKMDFKTFLRRETKILAFKTERFGKQLTPVDTGRLRASIGVSSLIQGVGHMVSTNVGYARFVHEGTSRMRARPFLSRGLDFARKNLRGEISNKLDRDMATKFKKL